MFREKTTGTKGGGGVSGGLGGKRAATRYSRRKGQEQDFLSRWELSAPCGVKGEKEGEPGLKERNNG